MVREDKIDLQIQLIKKRRMDAIHGNMTKNQSLTGQRRKHRTSLKHWQTFFQMLQIKY